MYEFGKTSRFDIMEAHVKIENKADEQECSVSLILYPNVVTVTGREKDNVFTIYFRSFRKR